jgi:hypothetical protein
MKTQPDSFIPGFVRKLFCVLSALVTVTIAIDSALHASNIMVFLALVFLSILFFSLYIESEKHKLAVCITCLVLGSIYLAFYPVDFTWWRFSVYSGFLYLSALLFFVSWITARHLHHVQRKHRDPHAAT